eukprot:gb/GECG01015021.1/.p1 GENE.gb/GECG01015021.1/~~gb/GECG01015021.1/.p1  ORF type:complete len:221 (+),score=3.87 gb/GECG01015021.1/:1-663(+)
MHVWIGSFQPTTPLRLPLYNKLLCLCIRFRANKTGDVKVPRKKAEGCSSMPGSRPFPCLVHFSFLFPPHLSFKPCVRVRDEGLRGLNHGPWRPRRRNDCLLGGGRRVKVCHCHYGACHHLTSRKLQQVELLGDHEDDDDCEYKAVQKRGFTISSFGNSMMHRRMQRKVVLVRSLCWITFLNKQAASSEQTANGRTFPVRFEVLRSLFGYTRILSLSPQTE